jgi:hypothetical protein
MGMAFLISNSVIVNQLDIIGLSVVKTENDSPVGSDSDGPNTLPVTLKRVQVKTGQSHVLNRGGFVELDQDGSNFIEQIGSYPTRVASFKESFQASVLEADDQSIL